MTVLVSSVIKLPPSSCESSDKYIDSQGVGLTKVGKSLREIFPHKLYTYQLKAMQTLMKGKDCFITVGTGSGKTEAFLFPMFEKILNGEIRNAIIIYPTKQLAEDQEKRIASYCNQIQEKAGEKITYSRYNGDLTQKELEYVEQEKPNIILATLDKLFYRCFKEGNEEFLDWLLNTGMLVVDEVHAGSGSYLAHIREMIKTLRKVNQKMIVVLASATLREVEVLRDKFLPTASIFQGKTRRGKVIFMVLEPEGLEEYLFEKLDPYLQISKSVALVFVDSIQKVEEIVAKSNRKLMKKTGAEMELVLAHSPFICINSQLTRKEKSIIIEKIHKGQIRIVFATSLLELGIDIPNISHIVNIGWPITGVNGLLQRMGRLRFPSIDQKKNFTIFLDKEKTIDNYYIKNKKKLEEILLENKAERILFDSKALQRAKAFVLLRVTLGVTKRKEIIELNEDEETRKVIEEAITILIAQGLLQVRKQQKPYLERTITIADKRKVQEFIRKHRIRSIDRQWDIVLKEGDKERKIGTIEEWRIIRSALPGNLLLHGSKGETYRVTALEEEKVVVEQLKYYQSNILQNKLKPPLFIIEGQARVQQLKNLTARFGKMLIRRETLEVRRYSREGKLITDGKDQSWKENHQWDQKTKGVILEIYSNEKQVKKEQQKQRMKLLEKLLKKAIEIKLHISETSLRTYNNYNEQKIVLFEKGGELGNAQQIFRKLDLVLEGIGELIEEKTTRRRKPIIEGITEETREKLREMIEGGKKS